MLAPAVSLIINIDFIFSAPFPPLASCWAYAPIAAVEAAVAITFSKKKVIKYSEQQVIDCEGNGDCNGGWPENTFEYLAKKPLARLEAYPQASNKKPCKDSSV